MAVHPAHLIHLGSAGLNGERRGWLRPSHTTTLGLAPTLKRTTDCPLEKQQSRTSGTCAALNFALGVSTGSEPVAPGGVTYSFGGGGAASSVPAGAVLVEFVACGVGVS
jgi:hypothetical protein